ncbi:MAG: LSM domain-containing protein [Candidatus Woesearchaeota archaeon]|jgi:small nuclear ribonucleoprotein (snRNP)-like protein
MIEPLRPIDALNNARNKRILVQLKNKVKKTIKNADGTMEHVEQRVELVGTLRAFDIHINISLEDTEERVNGEVIRKLGNVFVRGDAIVFVSPQ